MRRNKCILRIESTNFRGRITQAWLLLNEFNVFLHRYCEDEAMHLVHCHIAIIYV